MSTVKDRILSRTQVGREGCWIWMGSKDAKGYGRISCGDGRPRLVHRISYEEHIGPIPDGLFVMHSCDNPSCVNPAHLSLGTNSDNVADMVRKGRGSRGERRYNAKLTESDILAIRSSQGVSHDTIARRFGVTRSNVSQIRSGSRWSHVK